MTRERRRRYDATQSHLDQLPDDVRAEDELKARRREHTAPEADDVETWQQSPSAVSSRSYAAGFSIGVKGASRLRSLAENPGKLQELEIDFPW